MFSNRPRTKITFFGGPVTNERLRDGRARLIAWIAPKIPKRISAPLDRRLSEAVARIQGDRFAESNRITAEIMEVDLAALGYDIAPAVDRPARR